MKLKHLIIGIIGLSSVAFAQQGPSVRMADIPPTNSIMMTDGSRGLIPTGMIMSNDVLIASNAIFLGNVSLPGPLYTQNIIAGDVSVTNALTFKGATVLTTTNITQTVTSDTNTVPSNKAVSTAPTTASTNGILYSLQTNGLVLACATNVAECSGLLGFGTGTNSIQTAYSVTTNGLTVGTTYYISPVAGEITATQPTNSGYIVRSVGYAIATNKLQLAPSPIFIEIE